MNLSFTTLRQPLLTMVIMMMVAMAMAIATVGDHDEENDDVIDYFYNCYFSTPFFHTTTSTTW